MRWAALGAGGVWAYLGWVNLPPLEDGQASTVGLVVAGLVLLGYLAGRGVRARFPSVIRSTSVAEAKAEAEAESTSTAVAQGGSVTLNVLQAGGRVAAERFGDLDRLPYGQGWDAEALAALEAPDELTEDEWVEVTEAASSVEGGGRGHGGSRAPSARPALAADNGAPVPVMPSVVEPVAMLRPDEL